MCCIFSCFGWALDFLQRLITFGLACILCYAVCFGLAVAIVAGIAYGYNYSMAEFLTFTRSDVTVFMRRGQFYDKPDIGKPNRRSGAEDMFSTNISTDYEDQKTAVEGKPLAQSWSNTPDTKKYADILTKYNPGRKMNVQQSEAQEPDDIREPSYSVRKLHTPVEQPTQAPPKEFHLKPASVSPIISIVPNPLMPTVSWQSGSSKIVMRNFQPMHDYVTTNKHPGRTETLFPTHSTRPQSIPLYIPKEKSKSYEDGRIKDDDENFVPMRVWRTTLRPDTPDDPEDIDEENIVYKSV